MEMDTLTISAITKESHTASSPKKYPKSQEAGISTTSCLEIEITIEAIPTPVAWKTDINAIENPAIMKWHDIVLNAGTPI